MPDTSSKKMDQRNVVFPDNRHAKLAQWKTIQNNLGIVLGPKIQGELGRIKTQEANRLVREALATEGAKKDVYFKIGLVGRDLVLRIKAKNAGLGQVLGYEQKDALLLRDCTLKPAGAVAKPPQEIVFPTFFVATPGDCSALVLTYFQFEDRKGFGIKLSLSVEGADANIRDTVRRVRDALCEEYQRKARAILDKLDADLAKHKVRSGSTLEEQAIKAQVALESLLSDTVLRKEFKSRVMAALEGDAEFKGHTREWRIKSACTAILTTIKLATAVARAVASHGADVHAYFSVLTCAYTFYQLVKDFQKKEREVADALTKAIELYKTSMGDLLTAVEDVYRTNKLKSSTTPLEKLDTLLTIADDAKTVIQNKITAKVKQVTGKDVAMAPEVARKRYLVELGKLVGDLDKQFTGLSKAIEDFSRSSIRDAVQVWPRLQELKQSCATAKQYYAGRKSFAEGAKAEIEALGIAVDDRTDLTKLRTLVAGLRTLDKAKVIDGGATAAGLVLSLKSAYGTVKAFATAIEAFT